MFATKYWQAVAVAVVMAQGGCALERDAGTEDARITAAVQARFDQHPDLLAPNQIYVQVQDHVVYLSGLVNTNLTIANAEALALQVPGVARVVSSMAVED